MVEWWRIQEGRSCLSGLPHSLFCNCPSLFIAAVVHYSSFLESTYPTPKPFKENQSFCHVSDRLFLLFPFQLEQGEEKPLSLLVKTSAPGVLSGTFILFFSLFLVIHRFGSFDPLTIENSKSRTKQSWRRWKIYTKSFD